MRVKIGPYLNWYGGHQIADTIFFWHEKYPSEQLSERWDYKLHDRVGECLASSWIHSLCEWIYAKRKRTIKIRIDPYDVWSMDHTLSHIVVPMLKLLKECKHGAPYVADEDVPPKLRSTTKAAQRVKKNQWDTDGNHFKRWDWVMDEMIWAHEQLLDDDSDAQFYDHSAANDPSDSFAEQIRKMKVDRKGLKAHHDRIDNGLRLFGKYYRGLWD